MKRNLTFILLSKDPTDSKEITRALSNHPGVSLLMMTDDPQQAFTETARLRPTALIINFAQIGDPGLKLIQSVTAECPKSAVICASRDASPDLILRSLRVGARDFIRLPIVDDELAKLCERTSEYSADTADSQHKRGRAIAVLSLNGCFGCTLIATNLAMLLNSPTALVALNLLSGDLELL